MELISSGHLLVLIFIILSVTLTTATESTTFNAKSRDINDGFCITSAGNRGKCVHCTFCKNVHEGGVIGNELRSQECTKLHDLCCSENDIIPTLAKPRETESPNNCTASYQPECPWCVKLYRGHNIVDYHKPDFFCMGTLISTRIILTTATCAIRAQSQKVWARVPNSSNPNTNYVIKYRLRHPKYNSGTLEYDLALLTLDTDVEWNEYSPQTACLDFQLNWLESDCIGAGTNNDENICIAPLSVAEGNCGIRTFIINKFNELCGSSVGENCSLVFGTPIMCRTNNGPFVMTGLVKIPLFDRSKSTFATKSLLTNLTQATNWLTHQLKMGIGYEELEFF